jgi:hypothetical protein
MIAAGEFVQARELDQRPHAWCPVQSLIPQENGADDNRGDREISRLRDDPRHRAGLCQKARPRFGDAVFDVIQQEPDRLREVQRGAGLSDDAEPRLWKISPLSQPALFQAPSETTGFDGVGKRNYIFGYDALAGITHMGKVDGDGTRGISAGAAGDRT